MEHCEIPKWAQLKATLQNLSFSDFIARVEQDPLAVCLDARTPEEFSTSKIPGAVNLNYLSHELADELEALDADKHYYVYCRTSRRSLRICVILQNLGFENVFHLENGIADHLNTIKNG